MTKFFTRAEIAKDLKNLGVCAGDTVMVHSSLRKIGHMVQGPHTLLSALREVLSSEGTIMVYTDWNVPLSSSSSLDGEISNQMRDEIFPFDPKTSPASIYYGAFTEWVRQQPDAKRSSNPGASCAAIGKTAEFLTADHALNFGYGEKSPFAKFVQLKGKVLMLGAPMDTVTLIHHAEHLADLNDKRMRVTDVPLLEKGEKVWHQVTEYETGEPVIAALKDTYFHDLMADYLERYPCESSEVGNAKSFCLEAKTLVPFAVNWLEHFEKSANG